MKIIITLLSILIILFSNIVYGNHFINKKINFYL